MHHGCFIHSRLLVLRRTRTQNNYFLSLFLNVEIVLENSTPQEFTNVSVVELFKACETGPTVNRPYPGRLEGNRLQMSLQRQHFLLSHLKTLNAVPAGV